MSMGTSVLTHTVGDCISFYRVVQKSKPLPNGQKILLNLLKPVNEIRFFRQFKLYESSTIILFVGDRYSVRDLLSDFNNYT